MKFLKKETIKNKLRKLPLPVNGKKRITTIFVSSLIGIIAVGCFLYFGFRQNTNNIIDNRSELKNSNKAKTKSKKSDSLSTNNQDIKSNVSSQQKESGLRQSSKEKRLERATKKIDLAVKNKRISQEQADQLIKKASELIEFRENLGSKPISERREAIITKRTEIKEWATKNNYPPQLVISII